MRTLVDPALLHADMCARRARGERIGFVPTMGFLHDGHLSLMKQARYDCDHLVVSIYVNPLQFGANEDLETYPRDPDGDAAKCAAAGVDTLFLPTDLYNADHSTTVTVSGLTERLCGHSRPGHFDGVTTVIARLFGLIQPTIAVFGEKDYQQLAVIRRMVRDLCMAVEVVGSPLVRDHDGLALSSRNKTLNAPNRARALTLYQALHIIRDSPLPRAADRLALARAILDVDALDYLEIVHPDSLEPLQRIESDARALVAAWIGETRLIDNLAI
jgi:pantoate--beta-alanine ligase